MTAWYGNSKGHAAAGRKGGKMQGKHNNSGNFANDTKKAQAAGKKGGSKTYDTNIHSHLG